MSSVAGYTARINTDQLWQGICHPEERLKRYGSLVGGHDGFNSPRQESNEALIHPRIHGWLEPYKP